MMMKNGELWKKCNRTEGCELRVVVQVLFVEIALSALF